MGNHNIKLRICSTLAAGFFSGGIVCNEMIGNAAIMSAFFGITCLSRYSRAVRPSPQDSERSKEITARKSPIGSTNH
jgi:hypothetical protein